MSIKLKDLCELIVDCPHSTEPDEGQGYPIIRTPNIGPGYLNLDGVQRVGEEAYKRRNVRAVPQAGDLILAREAPAGNVGIIPDGEKVCLGQRTVLIRPDRSKADPAYLNYYLNAPKQRHKLLSNSNGATVSHVNMPIIHNLPVDLPPLPVQSRNAGVLSAYDKLIENNRRQIKLLEEAAQRLYKEWFVDLRFPGHETTPIHNGIPESWKRTTVGQSSSLVSRGVTPAYADDSNELVLGQRCVRNNLIDLSFARHHKPKKPNEKWLKKWDVLINSTGTGSLGRTAQFWLDNNNVVVDSHITIIRAQQREVAAYLGQWAFSNEAMLEALHTGSTGQTELPRDRVANCHILIPDNDLLDLFYTLIEPMTMRIVAAQQQIVAAREARGRLLPKLMSGEIEV